MNCPDCGSELTNQTRHGISVEACTKDHGMWFTSTELDELENEAFNIEDEKGTLVFSTTPTTHKCPVCSKTLKGFEYRDYDLMLEYCADGHGFWLLAGEDDRILQLMEKRKKDEKRTTSAEAKWQSTVKHLQSHSLIEKLKDMIRG